ncbi:MAG TPA: AmmeMemoRadiSam system protein A [Candidatus Acidoferrales bacterium]|nr:AmmeMemoRadiSam system protein A [Candidatus Acidoferrales bacterium]
MCPPSLHNDEKRLLLQIARRAIESALTGREALEIPELPGSLEAQRGAFVTLHRRGRLRGCIGRVLVRETLARVVAECAVAAALDDPRFSRLRPEDLAELQVELSVLSSPKRVAPQEVEPGIHGVVISRGEKRGILLPQVATKYRWTRERFLEETCEKAGLPPAAWKSPETRIEVFTAEVFSEADCAASVNQN